MLRLSPSVSVCTQTPQLPPGLAATEQLTPLMPSIHQVPAPASLSPAPLIYFWLAFSCLTCLPTNTSVYIKHTEFGILSTDKWSAGRRGSGVGSWLRQEDQLFPGCAAVTAPSHPRASEVGLDGSNRLQTSERGGAGDVRYTLLALC